MNELTDSYMIGKDSLQYQIYEFSSGHTLVSREVFPYIEYEDSYKFQGLNIVTGRRGYYTLSSFTDMFFYNILMRDVDSVMDIEQQIHNDGDPYTPSTFDGIIDMDEYTEAVRVTCDYFDVILFRRNHMVGRFVIREPTSDVEFTNDSYRVSNRYTMTANQLGIGSTADNYPYHYYSFGSVDRAMKYFRKMKQILLDSKEDLT